MKIEAAEARRVEDRARQNEAVGNYDSGIGPVRPESFLRRRIAERARRQNRYLRIVRKFVDG